MRIEGAVAVVTGGANGLGGATVEAIVTKGGRAAILDIKEEDAVALVQKLGGPSKVLWPGPTDITSEESVTKALDLTLKTFGHIDIVVNAAGVPWVQKTVGKDGEPADLDQFRRILEVNVTGTYNVTRLAASIMSKQKPNEAGERGTVVNIASVAAYEPQIGQAAYGASKGAVVTLTLALARDFRPIGIRVNTIAPGLFETPIWAGAPDSMKSNTLKSNEFPNRFGKPSEFAHCAVFLIENAFMNGEVVRIDAAARMARM